MFNKYFSFILDTTTILLEFNQDIDVIKKNFEAILVLFIISSNFLIDTTYKYKMKNQ